MDTFLWIVASSLIMSAIALVGSITLVLEEATLKKILSSLVAFAAGTLLGGAFFHMMPAGLEEMEGNILPYVWFLLGFSLFFALEQFLHWHHCNKAESECKQPLTYLILVGDGLHNFIGGTAVAGAFLSDIRLGIMAWLAAAAHEVPQELGDFGVLIHGGWKKGKALLFNVLSALTFLLGGLVAYAASFRLDVSFLLPFAAGNFMYIAASDLVPEINKQYSLAANMIHFALFSAGLLLLLAIKLAFGTH
jgi:zinc and cadmium transporter